MKRIQILGAILLLASLHIDLNATAQRASGTRVTYSYFKQPVIKTPEDARTYSVEVNIPYADAYNAEMAAFQQEEAKAQREFDEERKKAEEEYAAATEAYNSQGAGAKILSGMLLNDDGKPVKREVVKRYVPRPRVRNDIPTESEVKNGIQWDGFTQQDQGHYSVEVNMPEYTIFKKDEPSGDKWSREVQVHVPINYTITDANGQVVQQGSVQYTQSSSNVGIATDRMPKFKTDRMEKPAFDQFINGASYDAWLDSKKAESRAVGLEVLSEQINDQLGYGWQERTSPIYTGKGRKLDYSSLDEAALLAEQGLEELSINEDLAKEKLAKARDAWNMELETADLTDKKARINNKVAAGLYLNLALVNIILGNLDVADEFLHTVQSNDDFKGGDQREADALRDFLNDRRSRI